MWGPSCREARKGQLFVSTVFIVEESLVEQGWSECQVDHLAVSAQPISPLSYDERASPILGENLSSF